MTGGAPGMTNDAKNKTDNTLQRTGDLPDRTGGAIERSRRVLPLEPAAAHTAGPLIYNIYRHFLPLTTKIPNIKNSHFCMRANLQYIM